jgi:hypothetical protein
MAWGIDEWTWISGGMILTRGTGVLGLQRLSLLLRPPQVPHALYARFYPGLRGVEPATHRMGCGTSETTVFLAEFFFSWCNPVIRRQFLVLNLFYTTQCFSPHSRMRNLNFEVSKAWDPVLYIRYCISGSVYPVLCIR